MEEKEFLRQGNVLVTNARFVVDNATYSMNNTTSIKSTTIKPSLFWQKFTGIIGVIMILGGIGDMAKNGGAFIFGVALLAIAIYSGRKQKPEYTVMISTSANELQALKSIDKSYIDSVLQALNQAIIYRG